MTPTIVVIGLGAMGSAVARRLKERGATVLTSFAGRSAASIRRAEETGLVDVDDDTIAQADLILSIVPPAQAVAVAERFTRPLARLPRKAIFADCNAINVETVRRIERIVAPSGASFVDGGIIGPPPGPAANPSFYFSGEAAPALAMLGPLGLKVRVMTAPVGGASALKMSYAGINKGVTLLAAAMVLGATRAGATEALHAELSESQPQLLARLAKSLPDMVPKAARWAPEMEEIAEFLGDHSAARGIYQSMAELCRHLAADFAGDQTDIAALEAFVSPLKEPR